MTRFISALCLLISLLLVGPAPAKASTSAASQHVAQLVPPPQMSKGSPSGQLGLWQRTEIWLRTTQQKFYRQLTQSLKDLREHGSLAAGWSLAVVSFLYGIFHAAGPGHGKAVISAYLLANERQLKRGVELAFLSSLFQALSAIILVSALLLLTRTVFGSARLMGYYMELASYLLITGMGAVMLLRAVKGVMPLPQPALAGAVIGGDQTHSHYHSHHGHAHDHGPDCGCGHHHLPTPAETDGDWSLGRALAISLAVGVRPCSGALIVLIFASTTGIYLAGIGATFAMALGTAMTVSAIAVVAVTSRGLALRLSRGSDRIYQRLTAMLAILGGLALIAIGAILFHVTVTTPANPLL
ncbi:nickel/cobalt transporter [Rhodoligotrophos ferricapiens]|uniref:nickel/cobalt transporter n=1 Tax=Rhodoligotrophos ferricapiens TaxID=3069264 RepID=UPI00315D68D1